MGIVYAANAALRLWNTETCPGTIRLIPNTRLIEIVARSSKETRRKWCPGQHAYVSLAGHPFLRTFKSNPFTIASLPSIDGHIRVVAKILDGNTARLAQIATDDRKDGTLGPQPISIEGPYGVANHSDRLLKYDRILFVAGGVGATFVLPLYRQLLADLSPSSGSYRRQKVDFVWVARESAEVVWAIPDEVKEREAFRERLTVYLTGLDGDAMGSGAGREDDGIELTERETLLAGDGKDGESSGFELDAQVGRPDLRAIVDRMFAHGVAEKMAVVVCGPAGLNDSLRRVVGRHVGQGRD